MQFEFKKLPTEVATDEAKASIARVLEKVLCTTCFSGAQTVIFTTEADIDRGVIITKTGSCGDDLSVNGVPKGTTTILCNVTVREISRKIYGFLTFPDRYLAHMWEGRTEIMNNASRALRGDVVTPPSVIVDGSLDDDCEVSDADEFHLELFEENDYAQDKLMELLSEHFSGRIIIAQLVLEQIEAQDDTVFSPDQDREDRLALVRAALDVLFGIDTLARTSRGRYRLQSDIDDGIELSEEDSLVPEDEIVEDEIELPEDDRDDVLLQDIAEGGGSEEGGDDTPQPQPKDVEIPSEPKTLNKSDQSGGRLALLRQRRNFARLLSDLEAVQ